MKKIGDIYKEYKIMPNLAMHQMRVAAVAMQICDSLNIKIDQESIVRACILHDMGNIIKFRLEQFPDWNQPEGLEYWQKIKNEYIEKYGDNEHTASLIIAKELKTSSYVQELVNSIDSSFVEKIAMGDDICKKICIYVDNRVNPNGIVSAEEHSLEAQKRYENHPHAFSDEKRLFFNKSLFLIENQIFSNSKIIPENINDESIIPFLEILKDFSI